MNDKEARANIDELVRFTEMYEGIPVGTVARLISVGSSIGVRNQALCDVQLLTPRILHNGEPPRRGTQIFAERLELL